MKRQPLPCSCGGRLLPARLRDFDFSPLAGLPVRIEEIDGLRCEAAGGVGEPRASQ